MAPGALAHLCESDVEGHAFPVWTIGGHRVDGIRRADDPSEHRQVLSILSVRIALAVETFVVRADDYKLVGEHLQADEDVEPDDRVVAHLRELFVGELSSLLQHRIWNADLADVVQAASTLQTHPRVLVLR